MNPKDSVWQKTRNEVIATPVVVDNVVYLANGQDPEHGEGVGHMYAIDATKRGDITQSGRIWHYDKIRRSISTGCGPQRPGVSTQTSADSCIVSTPRPARSIGRTTCSRLCGRRRSSSTAKSTLGDEDGDVTGPRSRQGDEEDLARSTWEPRLSLAGGCQRLLFLTNRNQLFALTEKK